MALIELTFKSNALDLAMQVNILMPDQRGSNEAFKVLYLLHGYQGNQSDWMRYSSLERYLFEHRLMVVMPGVHNSYYTDMAQGLNYFTYVSIELPQFIESMFPVSKQREETFVAGLSMGGYGALKIGLTYPNRFSKVASLSGAVDFASIISRAKGTQREKFFKGIFGEQPHKDMTHDLEFLVKQNLIAKEKMPQMYIACGTEDFLFDENQKFHSILNALNVNHTYVTSEGSHNWLFWDTYIEKVLNWLKSNDKDA